MATSRTARRSSSTPDPAYVLQRHDWSESSLIVELFSRSLGRVVTVAKGAKKPTSSWRALLLPFQPVLVLLGPPPKLASGESASDILPLRQAEWGGDVVGRGQPLLRPAQLMSGLYLNELLLKGLARQDPHPLLFDAYSAALGVLARSGSASDEATVLRAFELVHLREAGVLPDLASATQSAEPLHADGSYALDAERGLHPAANGLRGDRWTALEAALASHHFAALHEACRGAAGALRRPLQALVHYHLGHPALATREVWQGVRRLAHT
jgi:DNA repair protein RecO (recombination protein O)